MRQRTATALLVASLAWPLSTGAAPRAVERAAPAAAELPGKPTGPILVEHRLAADPAVGVPLEITVTARVDGAAGGLGIEANATVPRAALVTPPRLLEAGEGVYSWQITVVPLTAEAGYLSVIVSGTIDGVDQARSVTISLRGAAPADARAPVAGGGETLIALPVQESP
jgi:hypothetical protein